MNKKLKRTIVAIFLLLYLTSAILATLVIVSYQRKNLDTLLDQSFSRTASRLEQLETERCLIGENVDWLLNRMTQELRFSLRCNSNTRVVSSAFYTAEGNLLARSDFTLYVDPQKLTPYLSQTDDSEKQTIYVQYPLAQYFKGTDYKTLSNYLYTIKHSPTPAYRFYVRLDTNQLNALAHEAFSPDLDAYSIKQPQLLEFMVQQVNWTITTDESSIPSEVRNYKDSVTGESNMIEMNDPTISDFKQFAYEISDNIVFSWKNPSADYTQPVKASEEWIEVTLISNTLEEEEPYLFWPDVDVSQTTFREWISSAYIHHFSEKCDPPRDYNNFEAYIEFGSNGEILEKSGGPGENPHKKNQFLRYYPVHLQTSHKTALSEKSDYGLLAVSYELDPFAAALPILGLYYLGSCLLLLSCMLIVLHVASSTEKQKARLEENRRNYTNAVAHEMKTPLGITRVFAENIKEDINPPKNPYYLEQIIKQTESMDALVIDMIDASKMDSSRFVLETEELCLNTLLEEELDKLDILAQEKQIDVTQETDTLVYLQADPKYLKKALWNLLSNAVIHNQAGGFLSIHLTHKQLTLSNSKGEDENPERNSGIGIYLAERILEKHHMKLTITENESTVTTTIEL